MKKIAITLVLISGLASSLMLSSVVAKNVYQLNKEADKKEAKSLKEEAKSSEAIDEGKRDTAGRHAREAAKEQHAANRLEHKADKKEGY